MPAELYTTEQSEDDVAQLRGLVDKLTEILQTSDVQTITLEATGAVTATGGTAAVPTVIRTDTWHTLGSCGAHYTVNIGRYRVTADNAVMVQVSVAGDGSQATSVTFANQIPAPANGIMVSMGTTRNITAGEIEPRLVFDSSGNVTVTAPAVSNTFATCCTIPLD